MVRALVKQLGGHIHEQLEGIKHEAMDRPLES